MQDIKTFSYGYRTNVTWHLQQPLNLQLSVIEKCEIRKKDKTM